MAEIASVRSPLPMGTPPASSRRLARRILAVLRPVLVPPMCWLTVLATLAATDGTGNGGCQLAAFVKIDGGLIENVGVFRRAPVFHGGGGVGVRDVHRRDVGLGGAAGGRAPAPPSGTLRASRATPAP